jgi:DNA-binding HxlR family transcriptional regulator
MVLLDALGKRWTLRVIWELNRNGSSSFRELQTQCEDVSPTSLNQRLKDLRELGLVEHGAHGYMLTDQGRSLSKLLLPLDKWATSWASSFGDDDQRR